LVFDLRNFPALRRICASQMTTFAVNCPLWVTKLGQLNLPSLWGNYMDYGVETINGRAVWRAAVWLQVKVLSHRLELWPIGCTLALSVTHSTTAEDDLWHGIVFCCKGKRYRQ